MLERIRIMNSPKRFNSLIIIIIANKYFQRDLEKVTSIWNRHRIRPSKNENVPHGRPIVLYAMPELFSTRNYMMAVDQGDVAICKTNCVFRGESPCDSEMFELLITYMVEYGFSPPTTPQEGIDLYYALRPLVLHEFMW